VSSLLPHRLSINYSDVKLSMEVLLLLDFRMVLQSPRMDNPGANLAWEDQYEV